MKKTNFDNYLEKQLKDPALAVRFLQAGAAWDVAIQIAALREKAGLTQKELAKRLKVTQQQISRLESPAYEGHSLSTLRRVTDVLNANVRALIEPKEESRSIGMAENPAVYLAKAGLKGRRRSRAGMTNRKS